MNKTIPAFAAAALGLALCGCASKGEREFGSSVRHMVQGQAADPGAPREGIGALDGPKAAKAVERYRADKNQQSASQTSVVVPITTQ